MSNEDERPMTDNERSNCNRCYGANNNSCLEDLDGPEVPDSFLHNCNTLKLLLKVDKIAELQSIITNQESKLKHFKEINKDLLDSALKAQAALKKVQQQANDRNKLLAFARGFADKYDKEYIKYFKEDYDNFMKNYKPEEQGQ